jgi:hypothetical protein
MPRSWLLKRGAKVVGPVTDTQLVAMARSGKLLATDDVSVNNGDSWAKAASVNGLCFTELPSGGKGSAPSPDAFPSAQAVVTDAVLIDQAKQPTQAEQEPGKGNPTLACLLALSIAVVSGILVTAYLLSSTSWFSSRGGSILGAFIIGMPTLAAIAVPFGVVSGILWLAGIPLWRHGIVHAEGLSDEQIRQELRNDARLVCFQYVISVIFMTSSTPSAVYLIRKDKSYFFTSLGYSIASLALGLWGVPWGPIYTVGAIIKNARGGLDLTDKFKEG